MELISVAVCSCVSEWDIGLSCFSVELLVLVFAADTDLPEQGPGSRGGQEQLHPAAGSCQQVPQCALWREDAQANGRKLSCESVHEVDPVHVMAESLPLVPEERTFFFDNVIDCFYDNGVMKKPCST